MPTRRSTKAKSKKAKSTRSTATKPRAPRKPKHIWPLQNPPISKPKTWQRPPGGGRLQSSHRHHPTSVPLGVQESGLDLVISNSPYIEVVPPTPSPLSTTLTPSPITPSKFLKTFGGPDRRPFDASLFAPLHSQLPPPRYEHSIVQYFLGVDPTRRPRVLTTKADRLPRNPRFMDLVYSQTLLEKTIQYLDNLMVEERVRIEKAMGEFRALWVGDGDMGWKLRLGYDQNLNPKAAKVWKKGKGHITESDLELSGPWWDEKRIVVIKCGVLEELLYLAAEIEEAVNMVDPKTGRWERREDGVWERMEDGTWDMGGH